MPKPTWTSGERGAMYKTFDSMIERGPSFAVFSDWYEAYLFAYVSSSAAGKKYRVCGVFQRPGEWVAELTTVEINQKAVNLLAIKPKKEKNNGA